jgi:hypothetical protein
MDTNNILLQADIIFNELQNSINIKEDRIKATTKYNELSPELKMQILSKTINNGDNLLLLACKNRLNDLANNIIIDCLSLGIENVLDKANYYGITPLIVSIQQQLYEIALKILNSNYINPNHKTQQNVLAIDFLIDNLFENPKLFIENKFASQLFSLLAKYYLDDDNEKYEFPQEYQVRVNKIMEISKFFELYNSLDNDTKPELKNSNNNYFNIGKYIPSFGNNRYNNFQSMSSNNRDNYNNDIPETQAFINVDNDLPQQADAQVLNNEPFPYHFAYDDDTPFLITRNPPTTVTQPIPPIKPPKRTVMSNLMNSLLEIPNQLSNTIKTNNNDLTNNPKTKKQLAELQANAAEKRILLNPPAKPVKNVTLKLPYKPLRPFPPPKPAKNVTLKLPPAKPAKNVTLKLPPPKPQKPTRIGGKTRKIKRCSKKSQSKNKRKYKFISKK